MYMKKFGLDDKAAFEVAKKHREYGRTRAIYEAKQYPDIESTIRTLKEYGCKLGVATLKSQGIAETVLKNQDLYSYMDVVVGMNDSETMTKADTIRQAMSTLCIANNVLMVGDSVYDFEGAVKVGVDFIGVLYGFGFKKEDVEFYSSKIEFIREPKELLNLVTTEIVK